MRTPAGSVLVVGAGAAGAVVALGLARRGIKATLIDARAPTPFQLGDEYDLRVYALAPAALAMLGRLGIDLDTSLRACRYTQMCVWEPQGAELRFDAELVGERALGAIVEDSALRWALWQALARAEVRVHCPAELSGMERNADGVCARSAPGQTWRADLCIAADGAFSPLREQAGIATAGNSYGERAVVAHVRTELPHRHTAWQAFTPDGPLAFLPLSDGRVSVVWSLKDARALSVLNLNDAAFCAALGAASAQRLGAVTHTTPRVAFPLRLQLAERYVDTRLALIGDAAHVVHPLAGQGLNLGLADAAALVDVLADAHARGEDLGDARVLSRYQSWRQGDVALAAHAFDALDGLFRADAPALPWLRRTGMRMVHANDALKRRLALHACGYAGRVPELARRD
jgi:2-octaprenyl-3-methyl-6-methoxy-1,4-benzoquinol hydroxylase/2-octaprenylphenol hydroxylase